MVKPIRITRGLSTNLVVARHPPAAAFSPLDDAIQGVLCSRMGEHERALGHLQLLLKFFEEQAAASRSVLRLCDYVWASARVYSNWAPGGAFTSRCLSLLACLALPLQCRRRQPPDTI